MRFAGHVGAGLRVGPAASTSPDANAGTAASAPTRSAGTCEDGTSSLASYYAPRIQAMLAQAATTWAASPPADSGDGVAAQPGLHFVLRSVTTTSWSTDYPTVDYTIPPVGALAPQPSPTDPSFDTDVHAWTGAQSAWKQSAAQATAAAATLAQEIRQFPVARDTYSAIYSCIAAADSQLGSPPGADTRLTVISDMQNNQKVVGLHLAGAAVLVVGICPNDVSAALPAAVRCGAPVPDQQRREHGPDRVRRCGYAADLPLLLEVLNVHADHPGGERAAGWRCCRPRDAGHAR